MPTAFRCKDCDGCLREYRDVRFDGEAKELAQRKLKQGIHVEIGFFLYDSGWDWVDYGLYLRSRKMQKHYSDFFL
jgi:hypothetical protein